MSKRAIAARVLPVLAVIAVLALSWIGARNVTLNAKLVACQGYGSTYGYAGGIPSVTDVNFALGPTVGGTVVTITGKGYCGGGPTTSVKFGSTPASSFIVNSDTSITATSPIHALGVVDVTVTNTLGTSAINAGDRFGFDTSGVYTMDGFGGFHPDDSAAITGTTPAYWVGFRIARAAHAWPGGGASQQGFTLDGYGGLHPYGPTSPAFSETNGSSGHYWNGFDIARAFRGAPGTSAKNRQGWILDGWGGIHEVNDSPDLSPFAYWSGQDIAKQMDLN